MSEQLQEVQKINSALNEIVDRADTVVRRNMVQHEQGKTLRDELNKIIRDTLPLQSVAPRALQRKGPGSPDRSLRGRPDLARECGASQIYQRVRFVEKALAASGSPEPEKVAAIEALNSKFQERYEAVRLNIAGDLDQHYNCGHLEEVDLAPVERLSKFCSEKLSEEARNAVESGKLQVEQMAAMLVDIKAAIVEMQEAVAAMQQADSQVSKIVKKHQRNRVSNKSARPQCSRRSRPGRGLRSPPNRC